MAFLGHSRVVVVIVVLVDAAVGSGMEVAMGKRLMVLTWECCDLGRVIVGMGMPEPAGCVEGFRGWAAHRSSSELSSSSDDSSSPQMQSNRTQ